MSYPLLSFINLPFQAGYESIQASKSKELFVVKRRIFEGNRYKYELQLNKGLCSLQHRVSMVTKGILLLLPFIGHITSVIMRLFSSTIFLEMPLDCTIKCSSKEKLEIAKFIYKDKLEMVNDATRMTLATILLDNEEGFHLVMTNDPKGFQKIIQQKPTYLEQIKIHLAKYILKKNPTDPNFIIHLFSSWNLPEDLQQKMIKELILQTKTSTLSHQMQAAIYHTALQYPILVQQLLINNDTNIALANVLLNNKNGVSLVIANIHQINLFQDTAFTHKIFQINPIPGQIKQHFVKQILKKDPADCKFIIHLFHSLNFNKATQEEIIKELLLQMKDSTDKMQVAIAHAVIEKHPRGPAFLANNVHLFTHTQKLGHLLVETAPGKTYVRNNITKFKISEEQKNSLLQKCITTILA
ncbi:MAG: hypothetical protein ACRCU0_04535 [Candidatus Rhabdochlamydia sp.]